MPRIHRDFPPYHRYDPEVPVFNLTPDLPGCFHRFFDTSPISPGGRYAAFLRMPDETRRNRPGEKAALGGRTTANPPRPRVSDSANGRDSQRPPLL